MNRRAFLLGTAAVVALPAAKPFVWEHVGDASVRASHAALLTTPADTAAFDAADAFAYAMQATMQATRVPPALISWIDPKIYDILFSPSDPCKEVKFPEPIILRRSRFRTLEG